MNGKVIGIILGSVIGALGVGAGIKKFLDRKKHSELTAEKKNLSRKTTDMLERVKKDSEKVYSDTMQRIQELKEDYEMKKCGNPMELDLSIDED